MSKKYVAVFTENQFNTIRNALEEYCRLRGEEADFSEELAVLDRVSFHEGEQGTDIHDKKEKHRCCSAILDIYVNALFDPSTFIKIRTAAMSVAKCILDAIRCSLGKGSFDRPLDAESEPDPIIAVIEGDNANGQKEE